MGQAHFVLMDFQYLKFPPRSFDGFWAAASLLHTPKRKIKSVLGNIHKILKPEGVGFISLKRKTSFEEELIC